MNEIETDSDGQVTRTLLSYDVSGPLRPKAARVCQIVFGYEQTVPRNGGSRTYRHPGYLERPGARWVGQSVLLLRPEDARSSSGTWGASVCGPDRPGSGSGPPRP